jgi:hypothetical protein
MLQNPGDRIEVQVTLNRCDRNCIGDNHPETPGTGGKRKLKNVPMKMMTDLPTNQTPMLQTFTDQQSWE